MLFYPAQNSAVRQAAKLKLWGKKKKKKTSTAGLDVLPGSMGEMGQTVTEGKKKEKRKKKVKS